jgi:TetR/AcrR family hemagglutinin/protease transcriptional regulator
VSVKLKGATNPSDRRPRARRMEPDERRKLLVACAVRVAAKNGLAGVRHSDVAREAEVSNATAYVYFATHEDLIDAILDYVEGTLLGLAEVILSTPGSVEDLLSAKAEGFLALVEFEPDVVKLWLDWSTAFRDRIWARYLELFDAIAASLASAIERGQAEGSYSRDIPPEDGARLWLGAAHMVAQMKLGGVSDEKIHSFIATIIRVERGGL